MKLRDQRRSARRSGREAALAGRPNTDAYLVPAGMDRLAWLQGWESGREEMAAAAEEEDRAKAWLISCAEADAEARKPVERLEKALQAAAQRATDPVVRELAAALLEVRTHG